MKTMQLTGSTFPYARDRLPLARALAGIAAAGLGFVSLAREHAEGALFRDPGNSRALDELRETILSYGLQCRHANFGELTGNARSTADLLEFIKAGSYLGIHNISVLAPARFEAGDDNRQIPKDEKTMAADRKRLIAALRKLLPEAQNAGLVLTMAPRPGIAPTGTALGEIHGSLGSADFGVCYDPAQVHFHQGIDPVEDLAPVAGATTALFATDHAGIPGRLRGVPPGSGELNLQAVLAALVAGGFDGPVIATRLGVLGARRIDREMQRAAEHLRAIGEQVMGRGSAATRS